MRKPRSGGGGRGGRGGREKRGGVRKPRSGDGGREKRGGVRKPRSGDGGWPVSENNLATRRISRKLSVAPSFSITSSTINQK
jgi:hypothetical protein